MRNKLLNLFSMRFIFSFLIIFSIFNMKVLSSQNKVAIILAGCGSMDGSEIREAIFALTAFEELGFDVEFFPPNKVQASVVDHQTGQQGSESRNILKESARIARGAIAPLSELDAQNFSILIIPGGLGVVKNLCDFATFGENMSVDKEVEAKILAFYYAKKPIGAICIAPVILAKVLGSKNVVLTVGAGDTKILSAFKAWGATHQSCPKGECVVDSKNLVVSTPAYMHGDSKSYQVLSGIRKMAEEMSKMIDSQSQIADQIDARE